MAQITIIGNLGKDLETKNTNGRTYHQMTVCENRKEGQTERTDWYTVFVESVPDGLKKYLVKGSRILVTGAFKPSIYQGDKGAMLDMTISANNLQLLNSKLEDATADKQPESVTNPF